MMSMKIVQFPKPLPPLSIYVQNSSTPLTLDVQFQTNTPPTISSPNNNQSFKRKHNPRMTIICSRSAFVFSINSLILSGFPVTSFYLAEASLFSLSWFYTHLCAVVQKYHQMSFIYSYSHF